LARLLLLFAGALMMALAVNLFLLPLKLAEGGVIGIGIILYHTYAVPVWLTILLLNLPLIWLGVRERGWSLLWKTVLGVILFAGFVALTANLRPLTEETFLAIIYGGILMGLGLGLVLRSGGTTGGTDILAIVLHNRLGLSVGTLILMIDGVVLMLAGVAFGLEVAMYSAVTLLISSRVVDFVQEGFYAARGVLVITRQPKPIAQRVMTEIERGCTILSGVGAYTGEPRGVVYTVVQRGELAQLKRVVYETDPQAFVVVNHVHEVLGLGFQPIRK
jgi:uncharacterized membrane-anchored protein YitT (DUF2179 family)